MVLKAQGSFFVGGDKASQTQVELGGLGPAGNITVNQMYVRYMVPQGGDGNVPVVMVHGATLTGKSWETTPDGRMGWDEYFVRKGHPVYVPDQVGRGRSGFNQALFNNVRAGTAPAANLPALLRFSDEVVWPNFRFGLKPGEPFADAQFPVAAVDELSKQGVPDVSYGGLPTPNPTFKALSDLARQLGGAVLMGHSQSGRFPLEAALVDPTVARGLVLVEPGIFPSRYTDEQVKTLAKVPVLVVFGDHRDTPTGIGSRPSWQISFDGCQELIARLKAAGGQAQMLDPAATRHQGQQPHDHAGQEPPADRRPDPEVDRRDRQEGEVLEPVTRRATKLLHRDARPCCPARARRGPPQPRTHHLDCPGATRSTVSAEPDIRYVPSPAPGPLELYGQRSRRDAVRGGRPRARQWWISDVRARCADGVALASSRSDIDRHRRRWPRAAMGRSLRRDSGGGTSSESRPARNTGMAHRRRRR